MVLTFTSDSFEYRQTVIVVSKCIFIYRVTRSIVVCQVDRASRVGYSTVTVEAIPYNFYKAGDDCYAVILVQKFLLLTSVWLDLMSICLTLKQPTLETTN